MTPRWWYLLHALAWFAFSGVMGVIAYKLLTWEPS